MSDRRLLNAVLGAIGVGGDALGVAYGVLDKIGRQPDAVALEKLAAAGIDAESAAAVMRLAKPGALESIRALYGSNDGVRSALRTFDAYLAHLAALGVSDWVDVDLSIVRGLAYYTGIVFELFDAKGELRAVCGGGRYDNLLKDLGGVDLPALGFGMGDVVLGELLKDRGLVASVTPDKPELFVIGGPGAVGTGMAGALKLVSALRAAGFAVDYGLSEKKYQSTPRGQVESAQKAGALAAIYYEHDGRITAKGLAGKHADAPAHTFDGAKLFSLDTVTLDALRAFVRRLSQGS